MFDFCFSILFQQWLEFWYCYLEQENPLQESSGVIFKTYYSPLDENTVLLDRNFTADLLDVSLNISKTTRTLRATNITLKTTTKMLPKIKKEISNF